MKFLNAMRTFRSKIVAGSALLVGGTTAALAADESGITTTALEAVITDGKAKGLVLALAVLGMVVAFKIVKRVSSTV